MVSIRFLNDISKHLAIVPSAFLLHYFCIGTDVSGKVTYVPASFSLRSALALDTILWCLPPLHLFYDTQDLYPSVKAKHFGTLHFRNAPANPGLFCRVHCCMGAIYVLQYVQFIAGILLFAFVFPVNVSNYPNLKKPGHWILLYLWSESNVAERAIHLLICTIYFSWNNASMNVVENRF